MIYINCFYPSQYHVVQVVDVHHYLLLGGFEIVVHQVPIILEFLHNLQLFLCVLHPLLNDILGLGTPALESGSQGLQTWDINEEEVAVWELLVDFLTSLQVNIQQSYLNSAWLTLPLLIISLSFPLWVP